MENPGLERVSDKKKSEEEYATKDHGQSETPDNSGVSKPHELPGDEKPFCGSDCQYRDRNRPLFAKDKPEGSQYDQKNPGDDATMGHSR